MTRYVTVKMTERQWGLILHALGNTTHHPDAMEAVFSSAVDRSACEAAEMKIRRALAQQ